MSSTKHSLRQELLKKREKLTCHQQKQAALALIERLEVLPHWQASQHIAFYYPRRGEVDARPAIQTALAQGKQVFLPFIDPESDACLRFAPYTIDSVLIDNRWGIPESAVKQRDAARLASELDIILMPLVGYDTFKNRLGMGGGYYDRTLAFMRQKNNDVRPYCLGLAYAFQAVEHPLPIDPWDVAMDDVICLEVS